MYEPKPISRDGIPSALAKAERYRLLNEPGEAESICLDVLQIEPANQDALVALLLSLTDQFPHEAGTCASSGGARRRGPRSPQRCLRSRVLQGHHPRAPRQGGAAARLVPFVGLCGRLAARGFGLLRAR